MIGVYMPNWIGDSVMALPFLARCRETNGERDILAVAREWVSPILKSSPLVDELFIIGAGEDRGVGGVTGIGRLLQDHKLEKFYLLSDSWRCAYLAWLSGASERIGFSGQGRSPLLTVVHPPLRGKIHRSERYLSLIGAGTGVAEEAVIHLNSGEIETAASHLESLGLASPLAIFPGSVAQSRRPPTALWKGVLGAAVESGKAVLMLGGKRDTSVASELEAAFRGKSVKSLCGETTLRETITLISQCSGAIASDSGLGHIAANLGLPTVSLFGAGDPETTAPLGQKTDVIFEEVHCSPCRKNVCHNSDEPLLCLETMTSKTIWDRYQHLAEKV